MSNLFRLEVRMQGYAAPRTPTQENRKVYRSGTTSSTMGHEGRRYAYMDAMESKVRKAMEK